MKALVTFLAAFCVGVAGWLYVQSPTYAVLVLVLIGIIFLIRLFPMFGVMLAAFILGLTS